MSGGVDSSTAAALAVASGDEVLGVTVLLWGGDRVGRSCSTADSTAAEEAAAQLGIPHVTIDRRTMFDQEVLAPFVNAAAEGRTLNPCLSCNLTVKWDALLSYAVDHGFDRVVTGHYAQIVDTAAGPRLARSVDTTKDQSYVLWGTTPAQLAMFSFPLGGMTKAETRAAAARFGLTAADTPDSMDLCFDRAQVIEDRAGFRKVPAVTIDGTTVGSVPVELVTVGQRRGIPHVPSGERSYVTEITSTQVTIGGLNDLLATTTPLDGLVLHSPVPDVVWAQTSAHGTPRQAELVADEVRWADRQRRVAPGQGVVLYNEAGVVVGGGYAR